MSIKRTIITAIVGLTLVAVVAPAVTQAVTVEELMAQIAALQAQLTSLAGTTPAAGTSSYSACAGVTFTRNLTVGSTGSDVKCLQQILNGTGYTVSTTGAGSVGNETTYFGSKTLVAVKLFQAAKGMTPANQAGPMTRAALNAILAGSTPSVPGTPVPTGAGLTVTLASNNPAAGSVVAGQSVAPLARLTFVNGDSSSVKVTGIKIHRIGISADSDLTNVYLFDGATRLTDAASVSSGVISFNDPYGLVNLTAGGSKTITVAADIYASVAAGSTIGVSMTSASDITSNASSVKGLPVNGNLMTTVSAPSAIGTVSFTSATLAPSTAYTSSSPATTDPIADYAVFQENVSVNNHAVNMTRLSLREVGSINYADLQNFRLYVDGVQAGAAVANLDSNGYVTFDLTAAPVTMQTGSRVVKVLADIVGGSNRTFTFSLRTAADVTFVETQYNVNVLAKVDNAAFSTQTTGTTSINYATITVSKTSDSASGNVVNTASAISLGKFQIKAAGERVKIDTLKVAVICTATKGNDTIDGVTNLRNGAIFANGVQIGSTTALQCTAGSTAGYTTFNLGSSLIVDPSTPVTLEVKADIYDATTGYTASTVGLQTNDTLQVELLTLSGNGQGQTSLQTISVPSATVTGNAVTVAGGGLTLSKYTAYTNQTVVAPVTNTKLAHFTLTAGTTESVNLNTIAVQTTTLATYTTNLYVKIGNTTTAAKATLASDGTSNTWSINNTLAAGQTIDVTVYGDVNSLKPSSTTGKVSVLISGTTSNSATAVNTNSNAVLDGQTITFGAGSLTATIDGSTPLAAVTAGGQQVTVGKYKVTASNDGYTVTETKFTVQGNNGAVISSAVLKDGSTVIGTQAFDSTGNVIYFTGLNVSVAANTTKVLTLDFVLATPSTDGTTITTGKNVAATMSYIKALTSQGVVKENGSGITLSSAAGNYTYVNKSVPTFTFVPVTGQGTLLISGSPIKLYSFTVGADAKGPVALKQLKFAVTVNDGGTDSAPALGTFKFYRGTTDITNSVTILKSAGTTIEDTNTIAEGGSTYAYVIFDTEETIAAGSSYTYTLKATPTGFMGVSGDTDSVSVSLANDATPAGASAGADATHFYTYGSSNSEIQTLATAAAGTGSTAANVIWSDNSAVSHSYTYNASSADWFNGYLIQNLPLDATGINYNN